MQPLPESFTIKGWCKHRQISVPMFYKLDGKGLAPDTYYVGSRRLISPEADARWLRAQERKAKSKTKAKAA